jgi:hypothetical protein
MRIIRVAIALTLAACASTPPSGVPSMLRGCWIEQQGFPGEIATTQTWSLRDDGAWIGAQLTRPPPDADAVDAGDALELRRTRNGFELCERPMEHLSLAPSCGDAFFGPGRANVVGSAWWEFDVGVDHLRLTRVTPDDRGVRFDGRRDAC